MKYIWQDKIWQDIQRSIASDKLPHAILVQGVQGIGKQDLANHLAKAVLCMAKTPTMESCGKCESCQLFEANTHPDLIRLVPTPPPNTRSKKPVLSIKIDAVRDLCQSLTRTSSFDGYRVAIIEEADKMYKNAANSLLKTLEEPGDQTLILLVTSKPNRLPVTIRSRCQKLTLDTPDSDSVKQWLIENGVNDTELAMTVAHGAPLAAKNMDDEAISQRSLLLDAFSDAGNSEKIIQQANELTQIPKERALDWLYDWTCDLMRFKTTGDAAFIVNRDKLSVLKQLSAKIDLRSILQFYDLLGESRKTLGIALNPELFWENLLISWNKI